MAMTLHNIGSVYVAQRRTAEARRAFEEALRIKNIRLGPGHPSTKNTASWLADL